MIKLVSTARFQNKAILMAKLASSHLKTLGAASTPEWLWCATHHSRQSTCVLSVTLQVTPVSPPASQAGEKCYRGDTVPNQCSPPWPSSTINDKWDKSQAHIWLRVAVLLEALPATPHPFPCQTLILHWAFCLNVTLSGPFLTLWLSETISVHFYIR